MAGKEEAASFGKADDREIDVQIPSEKDPQPKEGSDKKKPSRCVAIAVVAVVVVVAIVLVAVLVPTLALKGSNDVPASTGANSNQTEEAPTVTTPAGPIWGSNDEYKEQCATDGEFQYYCRADCMVNCYDIGMNGVLLQPTSSQLAYCSSTHELDLYNDNVCCCAEHIHYSEYEDVVVPCLNGDSPQKACDAWCHLHSEILMPGSSIDCDPGFVYCMPMGIVEEDCPLPIECASSSAETCCCDMMT